MSSRAEAFEHWIRTSFVQINTELENLLSAAGGGPWSLDHYLRIEVDACSARHLLQLTNALLRRIQP